MRDQIRHTFVAQLLSGAVSCAVQEQEQKEEKKKQHKQSLMELIQEAF